jgi:hypothetical protein
LFAVAALSLPHSPCSAARLADPQNDVEVTAFVDTVDVFRRFKYLFTIGVG